MDITQSLTTHIQDLLAENQRLRTRMEELVNLVAAQKEEIQVLRDEIAVLKRQKPRPKIPPSSLEGPKKKEEKCSKEGKPGRGKHPRHNKKHLLQIHENKRIRPVNIPEGAKFKGCQKYTVQDLIFNSHNTVYELERWLLPDGTYIIGQLPTDIHGHYGSTLVAYVLHQYYGCRVTEPLLLMQLREAGILISAGQLNNILINNNDLFHKEKQEILPAGIAFTGQIQADDTGARHSGKNGYSTIVGNEFFTFVSTTDSKSRVNFLQVLHGLQPEYLINDDAADYIETIKPSHRFQRYLLMQCRDKIMNQEEWDNFLKRVNITNEQEVKLATEAALFASLIQKGIPKDLGVHSDDAGQFVVFIHSLCWIHEERHYRKIVPLDDEMRQEIENIREKLWELYKDLKEYKADPNGLKREKINNTFDELFSQKTRSHILNHQLEKTKAKKLELLRVLEKPQTPLHNNTIETDAREVKVKLKVSGGTRSNEGKKCRDTFLSLKKTCRKLGINFFNYLKDRAKGLFEIPPLAVMIKIKATVTS